jgi:predicted DCC family thiol-disulfide oxidoreductase YuxK
VIDPRPVLNRHNGQMTEVLIYDGDCGFCTGAAAWCRKRFRRGVELEARPGIDAAYWSDDAGRTHRGHEAIGRALLAMGGGWPAVGRLMLTPPISLLARGVYAVVSRYRYRLPGSTDACRLPTT